MDSGVNKQVTTDTVTEPATEPAELVLKSNIFEFDEKTYRQMHGAAISTKFASPYAILFMAAIEEKI